MLNLVLASNVLLLLAVMLLVRKDNNVQEARRKHTRLTEVIRCEYTLMILDAAPMDGH